MTEICGTSNFTHTLRCSLPAGHDGNHKAVTSEWSRNEARIIQTQQHLASLYRLRLDYVLEGKDDAVRRIDADAAAAQATLAELLK